MQGRGGGGGRDAKHAAARQPNAPVAAALPAGASRPSPRPAPPLLRPLACQSRLRLLLRRRCQFLSCALRSDVTRTGQPIASGKKSRRGGAPRPRSLELLLGCETREAKRLSLLQRPHPLPRRGLRVPAVGGAPRPAARPESPSWRQSAPLRHNAPDGSPLCCRSRRHPALGS